MSIITLTTDFGAADSYVGQMKGVILGIAPQSTIVDLCHEIPPQHVIKGALVLASAVDAFPDGTIHIGVVDPDVGGERTAVAIRTNRHILIGPDNGLFTAVLAGQSCLQAVKLSNKKFHRHPTSHTFHGRDIFAPAAAHLANGTPMDVLGSSVTNLYKIDLSQPSVGPDVLHAHVIDIDRFGNLVTNLTVDQYQRWLANHDQASVSVQVGERRVDGIENTFCDAVPGQPVAYFGSRRQLEVAIRDGNAANILNATVADTVKLSRQ